jgi:hypothetical protein
MLKGFTDVVASTHAIGSWHTGALASHADELAAMPSLHIAWAVWCTVALWRLSKSRWLRTIAVAYPLVTSLAVLATGNHFVLDILGGLVVIALAFAWERAIARLRRRPGPLHSRWGLAPAARLRSALIRPARFSRTASASRSACHKVVTKSKTG